MSGEGVGSFGENVCVESGFAGINKSLAGGRSGNREEDAVGEIGDLWCRSVSGGAVFFKQSFGESLGEFKAEGTFFGEDFDDFLADTKDLLAGQQATYNVHRRIFASSCKGSIKSLHPLLEQAIKLANSGVGGFLFGLGCES
jgi:hypothetical protein